MSRASSSTRASSSSSSRASSDEEEACDDEAYAAGRLAAVVNAYGDAALSATPTAMSQYVREGLESLSEEGRMMFLDGLSSSGIENAWTIAGEGYALTRAERSTARGVDFHAANEILGGDDDDEVDFRLGWVKFHRWMNPSDADAEPKQPFRGYHRHHRHPRPHTTNDPRWVSAAMHVLTHARTHARIPGGGKGC